jgi:hypothetical protein
MLDEKKFKKKLLMRAFLDLRSIGPLTAGLLTLMAVFFIGIKVALLGIAGAVLFGLGLAIGFKRLWLTSDKMMKEILAEIAQEKAIEDDRRLDELQRRLENDGDPRTDTLLADLRTLKRAFARDQQWAVSAGAMTALSLTGDVDKLFNGCIKALEETLTLHAQAEGMRNARLRDQFRQRRDDLIGEVEQSLVRLGSLQGKVQSMGQVGKDAADELRSVRQDLDDQLEIARKVEERMRGFAGGRHKDVSEYDADPTTQNK